MIVGLENEIGPPNRQKKRRNTICTPVVVDNALFSSLESSLGLPYHVNLLQWYWERFFSKNIKLIAKWRR